MSMDSARLSYHPCLVVAGDGPSSLYLRFKETEADFKRLQEKLANLSKYELKPIPSDMLKVSYLIH